MLLCREFPNAVRVRPSRGDQGIDIIVPLSESSAAVYQVKKFAENLTASHWKQITKSYERLRDSDWLKNHKVDEWHLLMPLNPTTGNLKKLEEMSKSEDWTAQWKGLDYIEALVSKYPEVVDYYLRDGKARLEASVLALTELLRTNWDSPSTSDALSPAEVEAPLRSLFKVLNETDPFFAYGISISPTMPSPQSLQVPMLVVARTAGSEAEGFVTIQVIARTRESTEERPVPGVFKIDVSSSPETREAIQEFRKFGTPFTTALGVVSGEVDLPGGIDGELVNATLSMGSVFEEAAEDAKLRVQVIDADEAVLSEFIVDQVERSLSPAGKGARSVHRSSSGLLLVETRFDLEEGTTRCNLTFGDVVGTAPDDALALLEFRDALRRPSNRLRVSAPYGPATAGSTFPPADVAGASEVDDPELALARALVEIQAVTPRRLKYPDPRNVTMRQLSILENVATLVRGETIVRPWTRSVTIVASPETPELPPLFTIDVHDPLVVTVNGESIPLGLQRTTLVAATQAPGGRRVVADRIEIDLEPTVGSERRTRRVLSEDE